MYAEEIPVQVFMGELKDGMTFLVAYSTAADEFKRKMETPLNYPQLHLQPHVAVPYRLETWLYIFISRGTFFFLI